MRCTMSSGPRKVVSLVAGAAYWTAGMAAAATSAEPAPDTGLGQAACILLGPPLIGPFR